MDKVEDCFAIKLWTYFDGRGTASFHWLHPAALTRLQRELLLSNKHYRGASYAQTGPQKHSIFVPGPELINCGGLASDRADVQLPQWPPSFTDSPPAAALIPFNVLNAPGIYECLE